MHELIPIDKETNVAAPIDIRSRIFTIRGVQVMLDRDIAELYQVQTKVLNQAVKRNIERFPDRFMFQLSEEDVESLRSQFVTSNSGLQIYDAENRGLTEVSSNLPESLRLIKVNSNNLGKTKANTLLLTI